LHLMKTAKDAFLVKEWLAADADDRDATNVSLGDGVSCDDEGCVAPMAGGPTPAGCRATAIELKRLRAQGAMALHWTRRGLVIDAVRPRGTNRPWSPSAGDVETEVESSGTLARPVDATPAEPELQSED
jgi:competence protein ComEC